MRTILLPRSISLNTLKRETFDTASKTPQEERKKEKERNEMANCWILANMKQEGRVLRHHHQVLESPLDSQWANYDIMWMMMAFCCPEKLVRKSPQAERICLYNFWLVAFISLLRQHDVSSTHTSICGFKVGAGWLCPAYNIYT